MSNQNPPKSPTLLPPRKSVELEDPGAHDLDSSNDEEDVFSDARDELVSPTSAQIPITRVEKVDDSAAHGQVPGTEAYEKRIQDAVPDEVAIVPDGEPSQPTSRRASVSAAGLSSPVSVPKTVVEVVDPSSPSHGEIPGTAAHELRKADAVPDAIVASGSTSGTTVDAALKSTSSNSGSSVAESIPRTVVTRVDSEPNHGEVPERGRSKPSYFNKLADDRPHGGTSPIAADGGFGNPTDYDEDEESEEEERRPYQIKREQPQKETNAHQEDVNQSTADQKDGDGQGDGEEDEDEGFGDDFDDFEEGEEAADFGGFEEEDEQEKQEAEVPVQQPVTYPIPFFTIPDFSSPGSISEFLAPSGPHLSAIFPLPADRPPTPPPSLSEASPTFLTERSLSLWSQLVAPPPLQPPNWVRSRIRRLFLVSLGVPVDLDEILPASKQKKLILPYTGATSPSVSGGLAPQTAASRLRTSADGGNAANASDSAASTSAGPRSSKAKQHRRRGPTPPPEFDIAAVRLLCTNTTDEVLEAMGDAELKEHVKKLESLVERGEEVLKYWVRRKEAAVGEKEAFDGVIENLVRHAKRTR